MVKAHNLGLLVIPRTAKIELEGDEGRKYEVIVEERLDIEQSCSRTQDEYHKIEEPLHETVRQLTKFCMISGFADVAYRNIPLLKKPDGEGRRQVGLIDLERLGKLDWAVNGDDAGSCGIFRCMGTESQLQIALKEARKYGVKPKKETLTQARKEMKFNQSLAEFHAKRGITTGFEPIELTEEELQGLGLDLDRTCDTNHGRRATEENFTMRDAIEDLLVYINRQFKFDPQKDRPFKRRRHLTFEHAWDSCKVPSYRFGRTWADIDKGRKKDSEKCWQDEIVEALIDKGYIHSRYFFERHRYWCAYA